MMCGVLTPLVGIVIDTYGYRTLYILLGPVLLLATHLLLLLGGTSALVPLAGLGLSYRQASTDPMHCIRQVALTWPWDVNVYNMHMCACVCAASSRR
jgi:hypothetical protein